jgi:hypothetical protein
MQMLGSIMKLELEAEQVLISFYRKTTPFPVGMALSSPLLKL